MYLKKWWGLWLGLVLSVCISGCQTTDRGVSTARSSSVETLTQAQAERYEQALGRLNQNEPKVAEKLLRDLVRERADVVEVSFNLALSLYQQSKWQETENTVQKILTSFPKVAQAHNLAGLVAVEQGEFKTAERHYQRAIELNPDYVNALYNMALLQDIYLRNIAMAVEFYNRYLQHIESDEATKAWADNLSQSIAR